jgi:hypothetical protein
MRGRVNVGTFRSALLRLWLGIFIASLCVTLAAVPASAGALEWFEDVIKLGKVSGSAVHEIRNAKDEILRASKIVSDLRRASRAFVVVINNDDHALHMVRLAARTGDMLADELPLDTAEGADVIIPEQYVKQARPQIHALWQDSKVFIMTSDGALLPVNIPNGDKTGRLVVGVSKGVFLRMDEHTDLSVFLSILRQPASRADAKVVSFFDRHEVDIVHQLDVTVGDIHTALTPDRVDDWLTSLARWNHQLVFFVGHVENDSFVMRGPDGIAKAQLPLSAVMAAAEKSHSRILLLGCNTAGNARTGYRSPVNVSGVTEALSVLRADSTYGELFGAIGQASPGGLTFDEGFARSGMIGVAARDPAIDVSDAPVAGGMALQIVRVELQMPRGVATFFLVLVVWAILTLVGGVLETLHRFWDSPLFLSVLLLFLYAYGWLKMRPNSWRRWNDVFPGTVDSYTGPLVRIASILWRRALYLAVCPLVSGASAIYVNMFRFSGVFILLAILIDMLLGASFVLVFLCGPIAWLAVRVCLRASGLTKRYFYRWLDIWTITAVIVIVSLLTISVTLNGVFRIRPQELSIGDLGGTRTILLVCCFESGLGIAFVWLEQRWRTGFSRLPLKLSAAMMPARLRVRIEQVTSGFMREQ